MKSRKMKLNLKATLASKSKNIDESHIITITEDEKDELVSDLVKLLNSVDEKGTLPHNSLSDKTKILNSILTEPLNRFGPKAITIKESSIYVLTSLYCTNSRCEDVLSFLTGKICSTFFDNVTKAKCAKVVRTVLDMMGNLSPQELNVQVKVCRHVILWCRAGKRSFLRQRVEVKLASTLFLQGFYSDSLELLNRLLTELKKLDDKQLLVETYLLEAKVYHGLRSLTKAKASLTACRTCANAIYVPPALQGNIDSMNGILHCEEGDYNTAHSYFMEAFEQLDPLDDKERSLSCLKYMMLCRILDDLSKILVNNTKGFLQGKSNIGVSVMISGHQSAKYSCRDLDAMEAIALAASQRSIKQFDILVGSYSKELQNDILIGHHLNILHEKLLESNLIRIIEPYSCVEISHVALLIEMPIHSVEKKLSQMILDGTLNGILDQGKGHLIVYEGSVKDTTQEKGLELISNIDNIVSSLFIRSKVLCTMMP